MDQVIAEIDLVEGETLNRLRPVVGDEAPATGLQAGPSAGIQSGLPATRFFVRLSWPLRCRGQWRLTLAVIIFQN